MPRTDGGRGAGSAGISRRRVIQRIALGAAAGWMSPALAEHASARIDAPAGTTDAGADSAASVRWIATTQERPWREQPGATVSPASFREPWHVEVALDRPLQTIQGFGACFNELGWVALGALSEADRSAVFRELFAPGVGASFNVCRMPVGANDFSRDWYSYDETPDDFDLRDFSIANDLDTLVPFIRAARRTEGTCASGPRPGARRPG